MSINKRLGERKKDLLDDRAVASAYMFPEAVAPNGKVRAGENEIFVFQYYPDQINDTYNPEYATKSVPGGSHPLYQYVGGTGRDVTFTARFTAERDLGDQRGKTSGLLLSDRYTVDVRGALARLRSYLLPDYGNQRGSGISSRAKPPKKLWLVLEGLSLGGMDQDAILVILRSAPVTYESSFPNGHPRIVEVALTISEIVQHTNASTGGSSIQFIGRDLFESDGKNYKFKGTTDRVLGV